MFSAQTFQPVTPQQASPYAGLIQNMLDAYNQTQQARVNAIKAQYAQPMAQQDLQKAVLANQLSQQQQQWNPKIWQSEIGLRGAQSGLAGAQAGLANSQSALNKQYYNYPVLNHPEGYALAQAYAQRGMPVSGMPSQEVQTNLSSNNGSQPSSVGINNYDKNAAYPAAISKYMISPQDQAALTATATGNVSEYNQEQSSINKDRNSILKMIQDLDQFHNGYINSYYTGHNLGRISSRIPIPFQNMSPEQQTDKAAEKFVSDAGSDFGGRATNLIVNQLKSSKLNRSDDPDAELNHYHYLRSNLVRALSANDYMTAARASGMPFQDALTAFGQYNEDKPAYDSKTQSINPLASYTDYVGPQASNKLQHGQRVNPDADQSILNTPLMINNKDKVSIAKSFKIDPKDVDASIQHTAEKYNLTPEALIKRLKKEGKI